MNTNTKTTGSGLLGYQRYSNLGTSTDRSGMFEILPGSDDYETIDNGGSGSGSGSGLTFDWNKIDYNGIAGTIASMIESLFGKRDKYNAQIYQQINQQQQKTIMILWVVIGLMLALGVVLLIRKTK